MVHNFLLFQTKLPLLETSKSASRLNLAASSPTLLNGDLSSDTTNNNNINLNQDLNESTTPEECTTPTHAVNYMKTQGTSPICKLLPT